MQRTTAVLAGTAMALCALATAAPAAPAQSDPATRFQKVVLNDRPGEPMSLAVLPDRRVLHTARTGEVRLHDPRSGLNTLIADVPVYEHDEEGLQGIAIDPGFSANRWVYLYYSPPLDTPVDDPATSGVNEGDAPFEGTPADEAAFRGALRLARFKLRGSTLDLASEQRILDVPVDRGICCHVGGQIDFDADGNLLLSTGDDSNPFFSDGYIPIDERPGRNPAFDAQRTSANTNDLRGKLLRIRVGSDGSYTIPRGNLFAPGAALTRPEIYAMGLRNPFRFAVDRRTSAVYLADYSPDANDANPLRGPAGHGRWMVIRRPGNYGWPYCVTPEIPYVDYDFASRASGEAFDCLHPVNESPRNTGLRELPAVVQPEVWYPSAPSPLFPELATGGVGPMGGPAYVWRAANRSPLRWPRSYHGQPLFYEWTRDYVKAFRLAAGALTDITTVPVTLDNPMDMEFGPDGALYVLEYGDGYFAENPDAALVRIDYVRGKRTPVPVVTADKAAGLAPLEVAFSSAGTSDADGDRLAYAWDFDADGTVDSTAASGSFTFASEGVYEATLRVTDRTGRSASASARVVVGNVAPELEFVTPVPDQAFRFGDTVAYEVRVTDDTPVDCTKVIVSYVLGHDEHGHPLSSSAGCTGTIQTFLDSGHAGAGNLRAVFAASYTDAGGPATPPLSGRAEVVLTPLG